MSNCAPCKAAVVTHEPNRTDVCTHHTCYGPAPTRAGICTAIMCALGLLSILTFQILATCKLMAPAWFLQVKLRLSKRQKDQLAGQGKEIASAKIMQSEGCDSIAVSLQACPAVSIPNEFICLFMSTLL